MERFLDVLKDEVQIVALSVMALVYIIRIRWLMARTLASERTPPIGDATRAARRSLFAVAMPWTIESMTKHWATYVEFVVFHIGIAVTIAATFVIPYAPGLFESQAILVATQVIIAAAFVVGVIRLGRRCMRQDLRLMSSPDDYFSLVLLDLYLISAFFAVPNDNQWALIAFFGLTTFFLLYVPFSKISHYIYYPFARVYFGRHFGRRGVYPKVRGN